MDQEHISFSVVQVDGQSVALSVKGSEGTWRLPLDLSQATQLGNELKAAVDAARRDQKLSDLQNYVKQIMVKIPTGEFMMGADLAPDVSNDEMPRHPVTISRPFSLGKMLISQPFYQMLTGEQPSRYPGAEHPVDSVSWFDAIVFCNRLSELLGLDPCYEIQGQDVYWHREMNGYRLPTEAEWEYAARGGKEYKFAGGPLSDVGWYSGNSNNQVQPIAGKKANALDLFDMSGLVFEWCWDRFAAYSTEKKTDPTGPDSGLDRVCRGGAWNRGEWFARVTYRYGDHPHSRCSNVGFRIARSNF